MHVLVWSGPGVVGARIPMLSQSMSRSLPAINASDDAPTG